MKADGTQKINKPHAVLSPMPISAEVHAPAPINYLHSDKPLLLANKENVLLAWWSNYPATATNVTCLLAYFMSVERVTTYTYGSI